MNESWRSELQDIETARLFLELARRDAASLRRDLGDDEFRQLVTIAGDRVRAEERPSEAVRSSMAELGTGAMEGVTQARTRAISGEPAAPAQAPKLLEGVLTEADIPGAGRMAQLHGKELERLSERQLAESKGERDESLKTLSKLKELAAPPEYFPPDYSLPKRIVAGMVPLVGPFARFGQELKENWEEPSLDEFHDALRQQPNLTLGPIENYDEKSDLYRRYADAAWLDARRQAESEGRPLRRVSQLEGVTGSARRLFAGGAAALLGAEKGLVAGIPSEVAARVDPSYGEARTRTLESHPALETTGFIGGLVSPAGGLGIGGVAGRAATAAARRAVPTLAGSGLGANLARGALEAGAGSAAESLGLSAADEIAGRETDAELAATRAAESGAVGSLFGGPIGALRGIAGMRRASLRDGGRPHAQLLRDAREAGSDTSVVSGIKPGPAVRELNRRAASPQAALADELAPPLLKQAGQESAEYTDLLRDAEAGIVSGAQKMKRATQTTIDDMKRRYYASPQGTKLHRIDDFRDEVELVRKSLELSSGDVVPGSANWHQKARELADELKPTVVSFGGTKATDSEAQALAHAGKARGRAAPETLDGKPNGAPAIYTLAEMVKMGYSRDALLRGVLKRHYKVEVHPNDPISPVYLNGADAPGRVARFMIVPKRYNAEDIDKLIGSVDRMLKEGAKTSGGQLPEEFNRLSSAAHRLRDRLGASDANMAHATFDLPDGTRLTGYGAEMKQMAELTGDVKKLTGQSGAPERSVGSPTTSELTANEEAVIRGRLRGRAKLDPDERAAQATALRWSDEPSPLPRMEQLEASASGAGLSYPLPSPLGPSEQDALRTKLVGYGDPLKPSSNVELEGMAQRAGVAPRLRLMPGVHATNVLRELARPRLGTAVTTNLSGKAYARGAMSEVGRQLRLDAAMREVERINAGAAGAATVEPNNERRLPTLLQGIRGNF